MSRIRSTGTKPEAGLAALLRALLGSRRKIVQYNRALPGTPDFVVQSLRVAIFCDGCFYHGCRQHGHVPKSNQDYWGPKIARNIRRDRSNRAALRRLGYAVWSVWEHELRPSALPQTTARLSRYLRKRASRLPKAH